MAISKSNEIRNLLMDDISENITHFTRMTQGRPPSKEKSLQKTDERVCFLLMV